MKKYLKMLLNVAVFLGAFFVVLLAGFNFYGSVLVNLPEWGQWFQDNFFLFLVINDVITLPLLIGVYWLIKRRNIFKTAGFTWCGPQNIVLGIVIGISAGAFTMGLVHLDYLQQELPGFKGSIDFLIGNNLLIFILTLLINPLTKEVIFRGMIYKELKENMPVWPALLIQSVIYGLILQGIPFPVRFYALLSALLMGFLYVYGRSIWVPIIAGVFINTTYYIISRPVMRFLIGSGVTLYTAVVSLVILAGLLVYFAKSNHHLLKKT